MSIVANYTTSHLVLKDATFRIQRIWGSKSEGWNAWVGVYKDSHDVQHAEQFQVSIPFLDDENPFVAIYNKIALLPYVESPKHDETGSSMIIEVPDTVLIEKAPKRKKKIKPRI